MPGKGDGNAFHSGEMGQVRQKEIGSYRGKVPSERSRLGMPFPRGRYQPQITQIITDYYELNFRMYNEPQITVAKATIILDLTDWLRTAISGVSRPFRRICRSALPLATKGTQEFGCVEYKHL